MFELQTNRNAKKNEEDSQWSALKFLSFFKFLRINVI